MVKEVTCLLLKLSRILAEKYQTWFLSRKFGSWFIRETKQLYMEFRDKLASLGCWEVGHKSSYVRSSLSSNPVYPSSYLYELVYKQESSHLIQYRRYIGLTASNLNSSL